MGQFTIPDGVIQLSIIPIGNSIHYHLRDKDGQILYHEQSQENIATLNVEPEYQEFYGPGGIEDDIRFVVDVNSCHWMKTNTIIDSTQAPIEFMLRAQKVLKFKDDLENSGLLEHFRRRSEWKKLLQQFHTINFTEEQING
jgi:hypothetical protein